MKRRTQHNGATASLEAVDDREASPMNSLEQVQKDSWVVAYAKRSLVEEQDAGSAILGSRNIHSQPPCHDIRSR